MTKLHRSLTGFSSKNESDESPSWHNEQLISQENLNTRLIDIFPEIKWHSKAMQKTLELVYKVAQSEGSVLILGESGTGKELVSTAIHRLSSRFAHDFIALNCSAIPEELLEAELFGYEKGAFTGADRKRIGHFAAANHGTIFLDEIGDMPIRLQAKILRVLQERQFNMIGSSIKQNVDVRIIAATNIDLKKAVEEQTFRLDLFYRLNVLPIVIPPLRERIEDIPFLLDYFLELALRLYPKSLGSWIDEAAKQLLCQYPWPGNVRELQNLIERLVVTQGGGKISIPHLPDEFKNFEENEEKSKLKSNKILSSDHQEEESKLCHKLSGFDGPQNCILPESGLNLTSYIEGVENKLIRQALEKTQNNKNKAARLLGLNRTTLVERIKKRQIQL